MTQTTAQQLRDKAAQHEADAAESFARSDTDGFLSQWASGINARLARRQADIEESDGQAEFVSLLDAATGERVKAKIVYVKGYQGFGTVAKWIVLDEDDNAAHWVPAYKSGKQSKLAKLGLVEGREQAPAVAEVMGSGTGLSGAASCTVGVRRTDKGYPATARTLAEIRKEA